MSTSNTLKNFYFAAENKCPGSPYDCIPPSACTTDSATGRVFCCDPKSVCFNGGRTCASDGSTFDCTSSSGKTKWCCTSDTESCTGSAGQINICWSKQHDILLDLGVTSLNNTFNSLSSAEPDATTWAFDPTALIASPSTTIEATSSASSSTSSSTPSSTSLSTSPSTTTTAIPTTGADSTPTAGGSSATSSTASTTSEASSSKSLSGGAIGGIVVGAIAGVALIALALFFIRRRRRQLIGNENHAGVPWAALPPNGVPTHELPVGSQQPAHELGSEHHVVELPTNERYRK
ncbi:hypothetical protein V491_07716 [Pseudogymnoascus sp. VKM F-3775]|nr:hypothetical protein V491_07716 [Pseudogymnoascus sp. VKM F-3775]